MDREKFEWQIQSSGLSPRIIRLAHAINDLEDKQGIQVWGNWRQLDNFPTDLDATLARCQFVDAYLKRHLDRKPHPTRPNFYRPDLNGTNGSNRAWLMKIVLQRVVSDATSIPSNIGSNSSNARNLYIFPEDLPKIEEDIHTLFKFHGQLPWND